MSKDKKEAMKMKRKYMKLAGLLVAVMFLATMIPVNAVDNRKVTNTLCEREEIVPSIELDYEIVWDVFWGLEYKCQIDAVDLAIDGENNIFVIGKNDSQGVILKYDEDGILLSEEDAESYEDLRQIEITDLSEYMQGTPNPMGTDDYDFFVNMISQEYEVDQVFLRNIELNKETGEVFIMGVFFWTEDEEESSCVFITKYEIFGNSLEKQWTRTLGMEVFTYCTAFTIDAESNIYAPMMIPNVLVKLSSDGQIEFVKPIGIGTLYFMDTIVLNPSTGNIIVNAKDFKLIDFSQSKMIIIEFEPETGDKLDEVIFSTPYPKNATGLSSGQAMTCAANGDIFASSVYYEQGCRKRKLAKLDGNLDIQFVKSISYPITDMKVLGNYLITVGILLTDAYENIYYGATVLSATNGNELLIIDLGPYIYTYNFGGNTNTMWGLVIDNEGDLVATGCRGVHSDYWGTVSCIKTTKFRLIT